jgi:hypothetical protein
VKAAQKDNSVEPPFCAVFSEKLGAGEGIRTLDPNLGKVGLSVFGHFPTLDSASQVIEIASLVLYTVSRLFLGLPFSVWTRCGPKI